MTRSKLYALDDHGNRYPCPLVKAIHSEQENVWWKLILSDNHKTDIYLMETIDLSFLTPYPPEFTRSFVFIIEGHNWEKIPL